MAYSNKKKCSFCVKQQSLLTHTLQNMSQTSVLYYFFVILNRISDIVGFVAKQFQNPNEKSNTPTN